MSIGKSSIARAAEAAAAPVSQKMAAETAAFKPLARLTALSPSQLRPLAVIRGGEASPELVCSIRRHGVLVPLLAARVGEEYLVLLGEHRLAAAKELGLTEVPVCIVDAADEKSALRLMQEIRSSRSQASDSIQNEKFYAAAAVSAEDLPVFLL